jgi:hypothetical protein
MIKIFSLLLLTVLFSASCNSVKNLNLKDEKQFRAAFCTSWETTYMETQGSRAKVPEAQISQIEFKANGTFTSHVKGGVINHNGNWLYDPGSQVLFVGEGESKEPSHILKLTDKEMIMTQYIRMNNEIMDSVVVTFTKI